MGLILDVVSNYKPVSDRHQLCINCQGFILDVVPNYKPVSDLHQLFNDCQAKGTHARCCDAPGQLHRKLDCMSSTSVGKLDWLNQNGWLLQTGVRSNWSVSNSCKKNSSLFVWVNQLAVNSNFASEHVHGINDHTFPVQRLGMHLDHLQITRQISPNPDMSTWHCASPFYWVQVNCNILISFTEQTHGDVMVQIETAKTCKLFQLFPHPHCWLISYPWGHWQDDRVSYAALNLIF